MKLLAFTFLAVLLLPGCSGLFGTAGQTHVVVELDPETGAFRAEFHDGKDREGTEARVELGDGRTLYLNTQGSVGSTGQASAFDALGKLADKIPDAGDLVRLVAPGAM